MRDNGRAGRAARRVATWTVVVTGAVSMLSGCADGIDTIGPGGDREALGLHVGAGARLVADVGTDVGPTVDATWALGLAALGAAKQGAGVVVSPSSLYVALSMLADGSSGAGLAATEAALGASGDSRRAAVAALRASLGAYEGDPALVGQDELPAQPVVHQASQLVVDDDERATEAYLDSLWQTYGAGVLRTDLATDTGLDPLHAWVREHTGGLVERSAMRPGRDLVAVLQDAVAFAARWQQPFGSSTADESFTLADGTTVDVQMMRSDIRVVSVSVEGWQAFRLPYATVGGPGLHTDVLLPPVGADVRRQDADALARITAALDTASLDSAEPELVELWLPRLDLTTKVDLLGALEAAGFGHLMTADRSGIDKVLASTREPLEVGQAFQQAVLRLDEDGTRAAAVTEIGLRVTSLPMPPATVLHVDRPFLVTVTDSTTGWPVFLAAVDDPR